MINTNDNTLEKEELSEIVKLHSQSIVQMSRNIDRSENVIKDIQGYCGYYISELSDHLIIDRINYIPRLDTTGAEVLYKIEKELTNKQCIIYHQVYLAQVKAAVPWNMHIRKKKPIIQYIGFMLLLLTK